MKEPKAKALSTCTVALAANGCLTIMEVQQEHEGEQGAVVPAKSIWLNTTHAKALRDFLNEQYPVDATSNEDKLRQYRQKLINDSIEGKNIPRQEIVVVDVLDILGIEIIGINAMK